MKCSINFVQRIDFHNESLNGVKSCLFVKACKYIESTTDSGINESKDGAYIGTSFLNSGIVNTLNKVLFFEILPSLGRKDFLFQFFSFFSI